MTDEGKKTRGNKKNAKEDTEDKFELVMPGNNIDIPMDMDDPNPVY